MTKATIVKKEKRKPNLAETKDSWWLGELDLARRLLRRYRREIKTLEGIPEIRDGLNGNDLGLLLSRDTKKIYASIKIELIPLIIDLFLGEREKDYKMHPGTESCENPDHIRVKCSRKGGITAYYWPDVLLHILTVKKKNVKGGYCLEDFCSINIEKRKGRNDWYGRNHWV